MIGSAFAGYVYLVLYTALHVKISPSGGSGASASTGKFSRPRAAPTSIESRARDRNLLCSLVVCFRWALMVLAGQKDYSPRFAAPGLHHAIRQHYGFLKLLQGEERDLLPLDNKFDRLPLRMMIFPPFHRFFIHHPEELGIKPAFWQFGRFSGSPSPPPPPPVGPPVAPLPSIFPFFQAIIPLHG